MTGPCNKLNDAQDRIILHSKYSKDRTEPSSKSRHCLFVSNNAIHTKTSCDGTLSDDVRSVHAIK